MPEHRAASKREAEFFDKEAQETRKRLTAIDLKPVERYGKLHRRRFNQEYRYRVLGALPGKNVLDVGCGMVSMR